MRKDIFANLLSAKSGFFYDQIKAQPFPVDDNSDEDPDTDDAMFVAEDRSNRRDRPKRKPAPSYDPIRLPDTDLQAFEEFHKWLLKDTLKVSDSSLLVRSYLLAHTLRAEGMRNTLLDDVRDYFATNRGVRVNLDCMVQLAEKLRPHAVPNNGQNRLLEYLVEQLTYEIVMRGWEKYKDEPAVERLLAKSIMIVKWHLNALHSMNPSQAAVRARKNREKKEKERARNDAAAMLGAGRGVKRQADDSEDSEEKMPARKMVKLNVPENPSEKLGCCFHEHLDSRECSGQGGAAGRRRRTVVIDD